MNSFLRIFTAGLLLFFTATISAATAKSKAKPATTSSPTATDFQRTKTRIDALLSQRIRPQPLPANLPNPFQLADATPPPSSEQKGPEKLAPSSDSEMLLYYGASLRISGTVRINDQTHLVINQTPYKEGDVFPLKTKDGTTKLRVIGIAPGELTLGLNDAVQVIKFKK